MRNPEHVIERTVPDRTDCSDHKGHSQQYQMAQFVRRYYDGAAITANDIGAINFFSDIDCVDLAGLADRDVFYAKRSHRYTTATIDALTQRRGVAIAMVYDEWFSSPPVTPFGGPPLPKQWIRVARWKLPSRGHLGGDTVSFYAVRPGEEDRLRRSLAEFATSLPATVSVVPD